MTDSALKTCDNCGGDYEPYPVFIKDDFNSIASWSERKDKYENLCQDCQEKWEDDEL